MQLVSLLDLEISIFIAYAGRDSYNICKVLLRFNLLITAVALKKGPVLLIYHIISVLKRNFAITILDFATP